MTVTDYTEFVGAMVASGGPDLRENMGYLLTYLSVALIAIYGLRKLANRFLGR